MNRVFRRDVGLKIILAIIMMFNSSVIFAEGPSELGDRNAPPPTTSPKILEERKETNPQTPPQQEIKTEENVNPKPTEEIKPSQKINKTPKVTKPKPTIKPKGDDWRLKAKEKVEAERKADAERKAKEQEEKKKQEELKKKEEEKKKEAEEEKKKAEEAKKTSEESEKEDKELEDINSTAEKERKQFDKKWDRTLISIGMNLADVTIYEPLYSDLEYLYSEQVYYQNLSTDTLLFANLMADFRSPLMKGNTPETPKDRTPYHLLSPIKRVDGIQIQGITKAELASLLVSSGLTTENRIKHNYLDTEQTSYSEDVQYASEILPPKDIMVYGAWDIVSSDMLDLVIDTIIKNKCKDKSILERSMVKQYYRTSLGQLTDYKEKDLVPKSQIARTISRLSLIDRLTDRTI